MMPYAALHPFQTDMNNSELVGRIVAASLVQHRFGAAPSTLPTDLTLITSDNHQVLCHRVVVIPILPVSQLERPVELHINLPLCALQPLVDGLYGKPVAFDAATDAIAAFEFLQALYVVCEGYVQRPLAVLQNKVANACLAVLNDDSCFTLWKLRCPALDQKVTAYLTYHIKSAYYTSAEFRKGYLSLSLAEITWLLAHRFLNMRDEAEVLDFFDIWADANGLFTDREERMATAVKMMHCWHGGFVDSKNLQRVIFHYTCTLRNGSTYLKGPRLFRDLLVVYALEDSHAITYYVDPIQNILGDLPRLCNGNQSVKVPRYTACRGSVYQIGGTSDVPLGNAKADCFVFDRETLNYARISSVPHERSGTAVCGGCDGRIYVVGGHAQSVIPRTYHVEVYDPTKNAWKNLPRLNTGRFHAGAVFADGALYAIGGLIDGNIPTADCERLSRGRPIWVPIPPLREPRAEHQVVFFDGCIYAIGGENVTDTLASVEKYSVANETTWKGVPEMCCKRRRFAATVFLDKIFVLGGDINRGGYSCESFDGKKWTHCFYFQRDTMPIGAVAWLDVPMKADIFESSPLDYAEKETEDYFVAEDTDS